MFDRLKKSLNNLVDLVTKTELKGEKLDSILWDFKLTLLENDVALPIVDQICEEVKTKLQKIDVKKFDDKRKIVREILRETLHEILNRNNTPDLLELAKKKRETKNPFIIVFVGVNGSGKTTTIAKIAKLMLNNGQSVILSSSDTYRAGSIEQLEGHAKRLGVRLIKHEYGSDAAAVAFDAITHAKTSGTNVVLIDTAGRMQTNRNLMDEMEKIVRVTKPDLVIFVGDALAGNDAMEQAKEFSKRIRIDASILTKVDADAKGGAAISVAYITGKPTIFVGIGQSYEDLMPFKTDILINKILD